MKYLLINENIIDKVKKDYNKNNKKTYELLRPVKEEKKEEEVLTEGIKHFKTSVSLQKFASKLIDKASLTPNEKVREELVQLSGKVQKLAQKFDKVEMRYASGDKAPAMAEYKSLQKEYNDVLKQMTKERTKAALRITKSLVLSAACMTIPYIIINKMFPMKQQMTKEAENSPIYADMKSNNEASAKMLNNLKRGIGLTGINIAMNSVAGKTFDKIIGKFIGSDDEIISNVAVSMDKKNI